MSAVKFPFEYPASEPLDPLEVPNYKFVDHDMCHVVAVAKHGEAPGELFFPHGVAVDTKTNHIFVAEGDVYPNFARISVFSETGEFLYSYSDDRLKSLEGIAVYGNNLYVTDIEVHSVFHIKIDSEFTIVDRRGSYGKGIGQFMTPYQMSISDNGDLYIADSGNDRIKILDGSLLHIKVISHPSMQGPRDVKLTKDGIYVLSDSDSPCVHMFSHEGEKLSSLITRGEGLQMAEPYSICLDGCSSLMMSDLDDHQVKLFSKEGTLLQILGARGSEVGMFLCPTGLVLTSNQKLVSLSISSKYSLQIFY